MDFSPVIAWTVANWDTIISVVLQVIGLASVIVKLTPSPKDDSALAVVVGVVSKVALTPKPPAPPAPPAA